MPDKPLDPVELSIAVPMLLGQKYPDATVGITMSPQGQVKALYVAGNDDTLAVLLPFLWPFAAADDPDLPVNKLLFCTAGSLREAIVDGSPKEGFLRFEAFRDPDEEVPEDLQPKYDGRIVTTGGTQVARLAKRSLERFRDRVRTGQPEQGTRVTASFFLDGDAFEFVKLGTFGGDTEVIVTTHANRRVGLTGERSSVFWTR